MQTGGGTVRVVQNGRFGPVLVNAQGRALYRYTLDRKGVSRCHAGCASFWPPLLVRAGTKPSAGSGVRAVWLGTIKAGKGVAQVTYRGFPLYRFAADTRSGQVKGQGYGGKWYLVNTAGALVKHPVGGAGTTTSATTTSATTTSGNGWG
jgi:predicted lipoprotein with Yx(FWY)xxD motif